MLFGKTLPPSVNAKLHLTWDDASMGSKALLSFKQSVTQPFEIL